MLTNLKIQPKQLRAFIKCPQREKSISTGVDYTDQQATGPLPDNSSSGMDNVAGSLSCSEDEECSESQGGPFNHKVQEMRSSARAHLEKDPQDFLHQDCDATEQGVLNSEFQ